MNRPDNGTSAISWQARAQSLRFPTAAFVDGAEQGSAGSETFETINPATAGRLALFPDSNGADVDAAVRAARGALACWRRLAPMRRKQLLLDLADAMRREHETLALYDSLEMGKPISQAIDEALAAADFLQYYAEMADKILGDVTPMAVDTGLAMTLLEPRGVVGVITPWNFPMMTALSAIAPALAAGNTVVQKPSEHAPSSSLHLAALAAGVGIAPGVLNVLPGMGASTGRALALHRDIDKLHFTGSGAVGRQLMIYAGESNGKPVILETGGKSPQIVFADAVDIAGLGEVLVAEAFSNAGQICVSRTRLLVQECAREAVVAAIRKGAGSVFRIGDPLDSAVSFGPVSSRKQFDRVKSYLALGEREANDVISDSLPGEPTDGGYFIQPTLLDGVQPNARVAREEIFGPVLAIMTFRDESEAVAIANGTDYGLAATVWTRDMARGQRLARAVDAGRIDIRSGTAQGSSLAHLSAEPFRGSGHGVLGGPRGLDPYLRCKGVQFITGHA